MSLSMFNTILWVPFGIVMIISGAIFLTAGYKRGLWHALISLGATVVAALLGLLLAKPVAEPLARTVFDAVMATAGQEAAMSSQMLMGLVKSLISAALSLVLFSALLLVFAIVLKCVANYIQKNRFQTDSKAMKWAGLGVRAVDTLLFSLLLLIPIYGTIATYGPVAEAVVPQDSAVKIYMQEATSHPAVQLSGAGPVEWVYTGLSNVQMNNATVNVADMAETVEELMGRVEVISNAPAEELPGLTQDMVQFVRADVIEKDWCYDLVQEMLTMAQTTMRQELSGEDLEMADTFMALFQMSKEEFKANGIQILDFTAYILQLGVVDNEENAELVMQSDEFLTRLGSLMNCTRQAVAAKNLMIRSFLQDEVFDGNDQAADAFLADRLFTVAIEEALWKQEAEAFIKMTEARTREEYIEALVLLPCLKFTQEEEDLLPEHFGYDPYEDMYSQAIGGEQYIGENGEQYIIVEGEDGEQKVVTIIGGEGEEGYTGIVIGEDEKEGTVISGSNFVVIG